MIGLSGSPAALEPNASGDAGAAADPLLGALLDASYLAAPEDLPALVTKHAGAIGAADVAVYMVDYEQESLVALPGRGLPSREPLDVDATVAGRAYRTGEVVEVPTGQAGTRVWAPLVDGVERVGVLGLTLERIDDDRRARCWHLAALVAELLLTSGQYTDAFARLQRRKRMSLAAELQWQLLPPLSFQTRRLAISGVLEPAYEVGGDSFDYALNGDVAHVAVLDAMGHGTEAAIMATVAIGAYRHGRREGLGLEDTFSTMDDAVATHFGADRFVTALLGELDCRTGRLCWLNAGHPRPLLLRGHGALRALSCAPSLPVGMGAGQPVVAEEALSPGDRLLFFTDGVVEARSVAGEPFGEDRLARELVRETASGRPRAEVLRRLVRTLLDHQGHLRDDASLVLVEWLGDAEGASAAD